MKFNNPETPFVILEKIKQLVILAIVLWGSYIWGAKYIYDVATSGELFRFLITRHFFYYLQIILTMLGFLFFHVTIKHEFNKKNVIFYLLLSTILVQQRFFHEMHFWIREHELYFDMFKTGANGTVVSFQYARVLMLLIASCLLVGSFILVKKNFQKLFLMLFTFVFFMFTYNMHLHVGRQAYKDYEGELRTNIEMVLNNSNSYRELCDGYEFDCHLLSIDEAKNFNKAKTNVINRVVEKEDSTDEANKITQKLVKNFLESKEESRVLMEAQFQTDNLRAACYGFKIIGDKILILIDLNNLAYALDLYLIYFTLIINVFIVFWLTALIWVYKKHKNMKFFK